MGSNVSDNRLTLGLIVPLGHILEGGHLKGLGEFSFFDIFPPFF